MARTSRGKQRQARSLAVPARIELLAQRLQFGDVDFLHVAEMRDAALGVLHLHGDLAAQADDGDGFGGVDFFKPVDPNRHRHHRLHGRTGRLACGHGWRQAGVGAGMGVQVRLHDAPGRTGGTHLLQRDAQFPGAPAHGG
jgi:hypothetical protein